MPYWIGDGVFSHKGKDYKFGDRLPSLDKEVEERLIKKNKASKNPPGSAVTARAELDVLKAQVRDLSRECKKLNSKVNEQGTVIDEITAERDDLLAQIEDMINSQDQAQVEPQKPATKGRPRNETGKK